MVCRATREDFEMDRAGREIDGSWYVGRGAGRGVWWCQGSQCAQEVQVSHLARALRSPVGDGDLAQWHGLVVGSGFNRREL